MKNGILHLIATSLVACLLGTALPAQLVPAGASWRYLDDGTDQGTAWSALGFDDSGWAAGNAQLGYGDGDETTVVSFGSSAASKYITTYFRHSFQVSDPAAVTYLTLRMIDDDSAVVYLNGTPIVANNIFASPLDYLSLAYTGVGIGENNWDSYVVSPSLLVLGTNVLAVEVHQFSAASSDLSFDLELDDAPPPEVSRGPYLQMVGPDSIVVRWRTLNAASSRVQLGSAPGSLTTVIDDPTVTTEHAVPVTGLSPDTLYYYSIGDPTQVHAGDDAGHFFRTAPVAGTSKSSRIWLLGDCGTGLDTQKEVRDAFLVVTAAAPPDLMMLLGDNAYLSGTDAEYQRGIFDIYTETLRTTPMWATLGNHDTDTAAYFGLMDFPTAGELGGAASGTEAYYSFDYANVHFVCLDSSTSSLLPGSAMETWLAADLAATLQPWIIAFWHHPPYTKGSHDSDDLLDSGGRMAQMRGVFLPILEEAGVDLVFSGHSHSYERSYLLDGHYDDSTTFTSAHQVDAGDGSESGTGAYAKTFGAHKGAVYTVAGSSGFLQSGPLDHPAMVTSLATLGSVVLDVNDLRIDLYFLSSTGSIQDNFTLFTAEPTPELAVTNLTGGMQASFTVSDTTPGNGVILALSVTGPGPVPSAFGDISLGLPILLLASGSSDTGGTFAYSVPVPASFTGLSLWFQGLELTGPSTGELTNPLAMTVQ